MCNVVKTTGLRIAIFHFCRKETPKSCFKRTAAQITKQVEIKTIWYLKWKKHCSRHLSSISWKQKGASQFEPVKIWKYHFLSTRTQKGESYTCVLSSVFHFVCTLTVITLTCRQAAFFLSFFFLLYILFFLFAIPHEAPEIFACVRVVCGFFSLAFARPLVQKN